MPTIHIATTNPHKVAEFLRLCPVSGFDFQPASKLGGMPEVDESGTSFAENAILKATALFQQSGRRAIVLADDSGLSVDALDGAPGVLSARYAGPGASDAENRAKLLDALAGVPFARRTARFHCALALCRPGEDDSVIAEGSCEGHIALAPAGAGGFGYDPIFIPQHYAPTMAQLQPAQKDAISHRSIALRNLFLRIQIPRQRVGNL